MLAGRTLVANGTLLAYRAFVARIALGAFVAYRALLAGRTLVAGLALGALVADGALLAVGALVAGQTLVAYGALVAGIALGPLVAVRALVAYETLVTARAFFALGAGGSNGPRGAGCTGGATLSFDAQHALIAGEESDTALTRFAAGFRRDQANRALARATLLDAEVE